MSTAEVKNITAVDMMVQCFLYEVLGLITRQLGYSEYKVHRKTQKKTCLSAFKNV